MFANQSYLIESSHDFVGSAHTYKIYNISVDFWGRILAQLELM
jgi:hypothetical protein